MKLNKIHGGWPIVFLLLAAVIVTITLFVIQLGMADNGDYGRLMAQVHLLYPQVKNPFFDYVQPTYPYDPAETFWVGTEPYLSTQVWLVKAAIALNTALLSPDEFHVCVLSFLQMLLFLGALFLLWHSLRWRSVGCGILFMLGTVVMYADTANISYLNSLYSEASLLIFYLYFLASGFWLAFRPNRYAVPSLALFAATVLWMFTKTQNVVVGAVIALFFAWMAFKSPDLRGKILSGCLSLALALASLFLLHSHPKGLDGVTLYDSYFYGVLKDSPNPAQDLREFGISESYEVLAGTTYFTPKDTDIRSEAFQREVLSKLHRGAIVKYYITHPERLLRKLDHAVRMAASVREPLIGNYTPQSGKAPRQQSHWFSLWSDIKKKLHPKNLMGLAIYFGVYGLALVFLRAQAAYPTMKRLAEWLLALEAICIAALALPILAEGENDLTKHLYPYQLLWDTTVVTGVVLLVEWLDYWRTSWTAKRDALAAGKPEDDEDGALSDDLPLPSL